MNPYWSSEEAEHTSISDEHLREFCVVRVALTMSNIPLRNFNSAFESNETPI